MNKKKKSKNWSPDRDPTENNSVVFFGNELKAARSIPARHPGTTMARLVCLPSQKGEEKPRLQLGEH